MTTTRRSGTQESISTRGASSCICIYIKKPLLHDFITPDTGIVNKYVKKVDYILVHHTHADHVLDVPYIALKTGANVLGNESTANLMVASGLPEKQIITVKGGEDYDFGTFSIKVIPSLHSPLMEKRYFDSRIIPKNTKIPLKLDDYVEGVRKSCFFN
ncbi:MBL fold metallo-hydrolase [Niabella terrae]